MPQQTVLFRFGMSVRLEANLSRLLFIIFIFPSTSAATEPNHSTAGCYLCSGLTCAPHLDQLANCKSSVAAHEIRCFFVAIDLDHIYRGCYEANGTHVEHCNRHRLSLCQICRGQGCNNKPIFMDTPFSCRQCLQGRCHYTDQPERITYRTCKPFFYGHVPRCFVYLYYGRLQYFFSCSNDLPLAIRTSCEEDTFHTLCRYCDYPNCNHQYFANFQMVPHYRMVCLSHHTNSFINCNIFLNPKEVMGCYFTDPAADSSQRPKQGCLSELNNRRYSDLVNRENMRICFLDQMCNDGNLDIHNHCAKTYAGASYPMGKCSFPHALCMMAKWVDERGTTLVDRHCETRVYCSHPEECFFCDKSRSANEPCNSVILDASVYNCYYCNSAHGACSTISPATANRTHFCKHPEKKCFTHLTKLGSVVRGCFFFSPKANSIQRACEMDPENCDICQGDRCNGKPTKMYCYICSAQNTLCQYDQMHQAISVCPGGDTMATNFGCYTAIRPDRRVERGCWRGALKCPSVDSKCISCNTIGCNSGTTHSGECLECSGPANGDCGVDVNRLSLNDISLPCPVLVDLPLCYIALKNGNSLVERGCTAKNQYRAWMEPVCSRGLMNCTFCNGNNCNYWVLDPYVGK